MALLLLLNCLCPKAVWHFRACYFDDYIDKKIKLTRYAQTMPTTQAGLNVIAIKQNQKTECLKEKCEFPAQYCFRKVHKSNLGKYITRESMLQTHHSFCCFVLFLLVIQDLICWLCQYWPDKVFNSIVSPGLLLELHFCRWTTKQHFGCTHYSQNNLFSISTINAKIILFHKT